MTNGIADRDTILKNDLTNRDRIWIDSWRKLRNSLILTHMEVVNNRTLLESMGKRQKKLVKANTKILNWVMKAVSDKKKVPLPQFRISNYVPYTIVPPGLDNYEIPHCFSNPNIVEQEPLAPCRVLPQDATYKTIRPAGAEPREELDPVEEVARYEEEHKRKKKRSW